MNVFHYSTLLISTDIIYKALILMDMGHQTDRIFQLHPSLSLIHGESFLILQEILMVRVIIYKIIIGEHKILL